jgi:hypothetical protein
MERLLAILRRRWAGEGPEIIGSTLVRGALLTTGDLGQLARATGPADIVLLAGRLGILLPPDPARIAAALRAGVAHDGAEAMLVEAADRSRFMRAAGPGPDAALVTQVIANERAVRLAAREALAAGGAAGTRAPATGAAAATLLERAGTIARLVALQRASRRDPLGIGVVSGYVAAVELQAMRGRAALARVVVGWSDELLAHLNGATT